MSWGTLLRYGTKFGAIGVGIVAFVLVLLLVALCVVGVMGYDVIDYEYVTAIRFTDLTFMADFKSAYCTPFVDGSKILCASYVSLYFPEQLLGTDAYTGICIINDITEQYSSIEEFNIDMADGGRVRLGKLNFYRGFVLPDGFVDVWDNNIVDSSWLPHQYFIDNGEFPPYYELQTITLDYYIYFVNGEPSSVSYSVPEGGFDDGNYPYINLYVGPYYWFRGMLFYSQFAQGLLDSIYNDSPIFNPSDYDGVLPFIKGLFSHLDNMIDSLSTLIGGFFYGIKPFNLFFSGR